MSILTKFLGGATDNSEEILTYLDRELIPQAINVMNKETLPMAVALFPEDVLPSNQRNLTDVRTRIGILLEYEFAKAVTKFLPSAVRDQGVALTYVIANQFPDLAFRAVDGTVGIRFEMKAIQSIAEEKSANFSTLIKDIRKNTDFVVVLLWEWRLHESGRKKFPHIDRYFVMDAYQLAQMRDCNWLNNPPGGLQSARQGFDLTFAVNARGDSYNVEEGNLGKLMRIFDGQHQTLLPDSVSRGKTLAMYRFFSEEAARLGLNYIGQQIANEAITAQGSGTCALISDALPVCFLAERNGKRLVILGHRQIPRKAQTMSTMQRHAANLALLLNEKFQWTVRDQTWEMVERGSKPDQAVRWVRDQWTNLS